MCSSDLVDVVKEADKDVVGDVVECENWGAGLGLHHFSLTEVVLQQGFEIVTTSTEKSLDTDM